MSWKDKLFPSDKETHVIELTNKKSSNEEKVSMQKDSRGMIREVVSGGIGARKGYVDRNFNIAGLTHEDMWQAYVQNSWIRASVQKIIKEVVKYRFKVVAKDPTDESEETKKQIENVEALLRNPNKKIESLDSIRRKYLLDLLVYDAGVVEIVYGKTPKKKKIQGKLNKALENFDYPTAKALSDRLKQIENDIKKNGDNPVELYALSGADIRLNVDEHGNFKDEENAYLLIPDTTNTAKYISYSPTEIMYMIANPRAGNIYGVSPIETLFKTIQSDLEAEDINKERLGRDGMISGVLSFPGMSPAEIKKQIGFWRVQARTRGNKLVVTNNESNFVRVSDSLKDMEYSQLQKFNLSKIMAVYGLQPIVLGIIDATTGKLNSQEQREQFKSDAILPLLELERTNFNEVLIQQGFGYDKVEIVHEEPKRQNPDQPKIDIEKAKVLSQYSAIKINELRELLGLDPLEEDGDRLVSPAKAQAIAEVTRNLEANSEKSDILHRINGLIDSIENDIDEV